MEEFFRGTEPLWGHLACLLVQLSPSFQKDLKVLDDFLAKFSSEVPLALEFRHESWFASEVYRLLEQYGAALVVVDTDDQEAVRKTTPPFVYVRLRRARYDTQELDEWARWMVSLKSDVFAYVRHHQSSPQVARNLGAILGSLSSDRESEKSSCRRRP